MFPSPSILDAALHLSVYVGTSAGVLQGVGQHRGFFFLFVLVLHLPSAALALCFSAPGVQQSRPLVDCGVIFLCTDDAVSFHCWVLCEKNLSSCHSTDIQTHDPIVRGFGGYRLSHRGHRLQNERCILWGQMVRCARRVVPTIYAHLLQLREIKLVVNGKGDVSSLTSHDIDLGALDGYLLLRLLRLAGGRRRVPCALPTLHHRIIVGPSFRQDGSITLCGTLDIRHTTVAAFIRRRSPWKTDPGNRRRFSCKSMLPKVAGITCNTPGSCGGRLHQAPADISVCRGHCRFFAPYLLCCTSERSLRSVYRYCCHGEALLMYK